MTALLEPQAREGRVAGAKRMREVLGRAFETVASVMQARENVLVFNATAAVAADPRLVRTAAAQLPMDIEGAPTADRRSTTVIAAFAWRQEGLH